MILDYEMQLTSGLPAVGQAINPASAATVYGALPYDQKASGADPAVGDALDAFVKVTTTYITATHALIQIVGSSTGASGGNEDVLLSRIFTLAELASTAGVKRIGRIAPGSGSNKYRYLALKVGAFTLMDADGAGSTGGGNMTTGLMAAWLQKASDAIPHNVALTP